MSPFNTIMYMKHKGNQTILRLIILSCMLIMAELHRYQNNKVCAAGS